jgi:hypothetical protein
MNLKAAKQISTDIHKEFIEIKKNIVRHLSPEITIDHARELLTRHIPMLVIGRGQVLLDSLLNYLMEDAIEELAEASTDIKNDFYEQEFRSQIKQSYLLEAQKLKFSINPQLLIGGIAAGGTLMAGVITGLLIENLVVNIVVGLVTLIASACAFRVGQSIGENSARQKLESDVMLYLSQSEKLVAEWLSDVEQTFVDMFDKFSAKHFRN